MSEFGFRLTPRREEYLAGLGLNSSYDLIRYFPRRYLDFSLSELSADCHEKRVVIRGIVTAKEPIFRIKSSLSRFSFRLNYHEQEIKVIVFNRNYFYQNLVLGSEVLVAGKWNHWRKEIMAAEMYAKDLDEYTIRPVYRLPEGVTQTEFAKLMKLAYGEEIVQGNLEEIIPLTFRNRYRFPSRKDAYRMIHAPKDKEELRQAYRYLKYEELLQYSLVMQRNRMDCQRLIDESAAKPMERALLNQWIARLPFPLTRDQAQAIEEIMSDIEAPSSMYRLLQGDVGTGKTFVAMLSMIMLSERGYQAVLMAPTEILARQHAALLQQLLANYPSINVGLLVSAMPRNEKAEIIRKIEKGTLSLIVGTHALIQEGVHFSKLGLAVIDEQHRFGVNQRKILKEKGDYVELLMMSATPIPRTLALALYGDMEVSTLREYPQKVRQVKTKVILANSSVTLLPEMEQRIRNGEKIFLICPLIEGNELLARNVEEVYEGIQKHFQPKKIGVGLLHGRLDEEEKEMVMRDFKNGTIKVLVSTTVIEVGIDIPEASMMIIYDAERFGLAQIHQLRGRIGRAGQEAACYLLTRQNDEETLARLQFLEGENDGFEIARYDLSSRGPGDLIGVRQSGIPVFRLANLVDDLKILEIARDDAIAIWNNPEHQENQNIITISMQNKLLDYNV